MSDFLWQLQLFLVIFRFPAARFFSLSAALPLHSSHAIVQFASNKNMPSQLFYVGCLFSFGLRMIIFQFGWNVAKSKMENQEAIATFYLLGEFE